MSEEIKIITKSAAGKAIGAIDLLKASLEYIKPYDPSINYTPKEREPYDALSDRFIRAVEISIKFFQSYERYLYAESSDTLRDLLNRMEKVEMISSVSLWIEMREIRNLVVHDYLPGYVKDIYDSIMGKFGDELMNLKKRILTVFDNNS